MSQPFEAQDKLKLRPPRKAKPYAGPFEAPLDRRGKQDKLKLRPPKKKKRR
jgi:hypothetical protein